MTARRRSRPAVAAPDLFTLGSNGGDDAPLSLAGFERQLARRAAAPGESAESAISVATLTQTIKDILEGAFTPLWVRGEVSDFKQHRNGHWYFSLRGGEASIRCVVWSRDARRIPAPPDEGMAVVALAEVGVYAARGDLQLNVKALDAVGDGLWRKAFELTRRSLEAEGLLDPQRKRDLPFLPRRIAVITSADGAALHDVISVVRRRNPLVELVLIPAAVQGDGAPDSLCAALDRLDAWGGADLLIIGRGGGSREDLWAFNSELLARRLARCPIPTISAVGHEVDLSICDLVADWRAPTPSAAAERAVPVLRELQHVTRDLGERLRSAAIEPVRAARPALREVARRCANAATRIVEHRRLAMNACAGKLEALSPLATMARGYAVVTSDGRHAVTSAGALATGDALHVRFRDGRAEARVERVTRHESGDHAADELRDRSPGRNATEEG